MLPVTVPLRDGETPASFVSRLARANGRDRARHFCRDVGLDFQHVVDGVGYRVGDPQRVKRTVKAPRPLNA